MKQLQQVLFLVFILAIFTNLFAQDYYTGISTLNETFVSDLQTLIRSNYVKKSYDSYDENMIPSFYANDNGNGTNSVFCVYSSYEYIYSGTFTWDTFSREHTFCYSWMPSNGSTSTDEYSDYHHLFPTHQNGANGVRSNHPLGIVQTVTSSFGDATYGTNSIGDAVYEPRDEQKGDAARALFYMVLKYDGLGGLNWNFNWLNGTRLPSLNEGEQNLQTLLDWHAQDPPDLTEIARNDHIYTLQNNRNPFIDHPEYTAFIDFNNMQKATSTGEVDSTVQNLFFTEYIEGSSNNKAVEIGSKSTNTVNLQTDGYKVEIYYNGSTSASATINLTGSIASHGVFVLANSSANATILGVANQTSGSLSFNGDDAVVLKKGIKIIDVIGQIGFDPGTEWGSGSISTADNTIRRKTEVGIGDSVGTDVFVPSLEWDGFAIDTFDGLGSAVLPVELTSFTAKSTKAGVMLNWTTATEVNNYGFQVESRKDKGESEWEKVGFVEGHGNSNSPKEYSFFDNSGATSYRLKQVDFNGNYEYSDVVTVSSVLTKTELYQNSPNPFNPSTKISFSLAETGRVNVSVYNVIGQKVAELVNQTMESGIHNVDFNASNFTSGLYIYRLETPNYSKTMKMLLIK